MDDDDDDDDDNDDDEMTHNNLWESYEQGIEWTKVKKVDNLLLAPLESEATKNNWKW